MAASGSVLRAQIDEQGYAVVPGVVPPEQLEAVVEDIWRHTGARSDDRESWYRPGIVGATGMVEMYHYQSMWDNRQHPALHELFADILGTERLWVSLDRVNLKPPVDRRHPEYDHPGFMHWDVDISRYPDIPFRLQGVLALSDTDESMGGFQCLPDLYRELGAWISRRRAEGAELTRSAPDGYPVVRPEMRAGDLLVWTTLLPHGNGRNVSDRPRLAQYITMSPERCADQEARSTRIRCWQECLPPPSPAFPGDPRRIEEQRRQPARLTALGRRLLGLDPWP